MHTDHFPLPTCPTRSRRSYRAVSVKRAFQSDIVGAPLFEARADIMRPSAPADAAGEGGWYEEYHPYGTTAWRAPGGGEVSAKRYKYTGMERDEETGLQCHGVRYYCGWLGRWVSADPIGLAGGDNVHCYSTSNPLVKLDIHGTQDEEASSSIDRSTASVPLFPELLSVPSSPVFGLEALKSGAEELHFNDQQLVSIRESSLLRDRESGFIIWDVKGQAAAYFGGIQQSDKKFEVEAEITDKERADIARLFGVDVKEVVAIGFGHSEPTLLPGTVTKPEGSFGSAFDTETITQSGLQVFLTFDTITPPTNEMESRAQLRANITADATHNPTTSEISVLYISASPSPKKVSISPRPVAELARAIHETTGRTTSAWHGVANSFRRVYPEP